MTPSPTRSCSSSPTTASISRLAKKLAFIATAGGAVLGSASPAAAHALHTTGGSASSLDVAVTLLHLAAAVVWLGGVVWVALRRGDWLGAARRFRPVGLTAAIVLVATGVANLRIHVSGHPVTGTYMHVLIAKMLGVGVVLTLAVLVHRRLRSTTGVPSRGLVRTEALMLIGVVGAGAALAALPVATLPRIRTFALSQAVEVRVGSRVVKASGTDSGECASRAVGSFLAGRSLRTAPCDTTSARAGQLGATFVHYLQDKNVRNLVLVTDGSARSQAMAAGVEAAASGAGIDVQRVDAPDAGSITSWGDAAVVTSGWLGAERAVSALEHAPAPPVRGAFLAPWLLSSTLTGAPGRVQLAVGLTFDPTSPAAQEYLVALAKRAPGEGASAVGFEAWARATKGSFPTGQALQFFTPARIEFLPASLSEGHNHGAAPSWVRGGRLAAVSGLVRLTG